MKKVAKKIGKTIQARTDSFMVSKPVFRSICVMKFACTNAKTKQKIALSKCTNQLATLCLPCYASKRACTIVQHYISENTTIYTNVRKHSSNAKKRGLHLFNNKASKKQLLRLAQCVALRQTTTCTTYSQRWLDCWPLAHQETVGRGNADEGDDDAATGPFNGLTCACASLYCKPGRETPTCAEYHKVSP